MILLLERARPILPETMLDVNLLQVFIWYVTLMFFVSLAFRLRFYYAIYEVTLYVAESCPSVFKLIHEHWFLCVRDRFLWLVGVYGGFLAAYVFLSRVVWNMASISARELAILDPALLLMTLVSMGCMLAVDIVLTVQTSVIDKRRVLSDLKFAEDWLGSRFGAVMQLLGKWNPIKNYADNLTAETMLWLNILFRGSMRLMILQTALRVVVGTCLFVTQALV